MRPPISNPQFYWDRSEEAYTMSERMNDHSARIMMINIGKSYARLAVHAEQQQILDKRLDHEMTEESLEKLDALLNIDRSLDKLGKRRL